MDLGDVEAMKAMSIDDVENVCVKQQQEKLENKGYIAADISGVTIENSKEKKTASKCKTRNA